MASHNRVFLREVRDGGGELGGVFGCVIGCVYSPRPLVRDVGSALDSKLCRHQSPCTQNTVDPH